jgi:hypothetical protein
MVTRFYLNEKAKLGQVLQLLITALEKYNARDMDAGIALKRALDQAIANYKELGKSNQESHLHTLQAEWVMAQRGINPQTLEKVTVRRNELANGTMFKVMQRAQQQLAADIEDVEMVLKEAGALLGQIIVAALQGRLIAPADIQAADSPDKIEMLWKQLGNDANILLGQQRVLLLVSRFDALLIFGDLLRQLA